MVAYHDDEWGVPHHDDRALFELVTLEGAQAGLSWTTILRKRDGYRNAFAGFDAAKVARYTPARIDRLVLDPGIVRHRGKIESTVANARAVVAVQREFGSLDAFLWGLAGPTSQHAIATTADLDASTEASKALSKELKRRGFGFVGPTTMYAFMQAAGFVNDHVTTCFRWRELGGTKGR
jgi:DNA-3-methyladenine glycosylase I